MHLWGARQEVPPPSVGAGSPMPDLGIKLHHIIAAADEFSKFSMYWDLMPSAKLNYIHDFRGFFNCISQVMSLVRTVGQLDV